MTLYPPRKGTWTVAILLGAISILNHYGKLGIPIISQGEFIILALAFLLLLLGTAIDSL